MGQKKYNEFTIQVDKGKIIEKMPTARKSVMIYEHEAELLNNVSKQTKFYYELAEVSKETITIEKSEKLLNDLRFEAKELGIKGYQIMKKEKLIEKINEAKQTKND
jgi:hypothetical protein